MKMMYKSLEDDSSIREDGVMGSKTRRCLQIVIDVFLFFTVSVPVFVVGQILGPFHRGFFCDDESIQKPFLGDTVSTTNLFLFGLAFPIVSIVCIEFLYLRKRVEKQYVKTSCSSGAKMVGVFLYGFMVTILLTEVGKLTVGRLRPKIIDTCKPNFTQINCSLGYITDFNCTNTEASKEMLEDARKSFPSGHASLAAFTGMFLVYYFHFRVTTTMSMMLRFMMQAIAAGAAMFCGLSRVMNNRHHPEDVLAGMALGTCVAIWTFLAVGNRCMGASLLSGSSRRCQAVGEDYSPDPGSIQTDILGHGNSRNNRPLAYNHD